MNVRSRGLALVAAGALAAAGLAVTAPMASAAPSSSTASFCKGATQTQPCTVEINYSAHSKGVNEGETLTPQFQGGPNQSADFQVFSVEADGSFKPVSDKVTVKTDAKGAATATFTVKKLVAPMVGGDHFVVQASDVKKGDNLIPEGNNKINPFIVNSARAQVTKVPEGNLQNGTLYNISLDGGLPGDKYQFQVKVGNDWKNITYKDSSTISGEHVASVGFQLPDLARGEYPVRMVNVTKSETVFESTLKVGTGTDPKPTTPAPTKPGTPAPTKPGTPGKGGLAKTGV